MKYIIILLLNFLLFIIYSKMNHNGGFPPIFEGGKKEVIQREVSAQNVLSLSQILNNKSNKLLIKRQEPLTFNVVDSKPNFSKSGKK